ncbi:hypothetical protein LGN17_36205, partial [Burkholderia sp. AU30280]|uniref:ESPR-type extended signal peptide-containing protein n=1 Tax=Burkholderia sp. AU30280 TaxID=2879628 RepID=UPI0021F42610
MSASCLIIESTCKKYIGSRSSNLVSHFRKEAIDVNKTYRTVWNPKTGTWVAAAETVRARKKSNSTMRSSVTAAVAVMAGVGGVGFIIDADAQTANGNGALNLCGGTNGATGHTFGYSGQTVNANCAPIGTNNPSLQGHAPSFLLGNGGDLNGASGTGATVSTASVAGSRDGHLMLYGANGVHVTGATDFANTVSMTNNRIQNLAAGTAGTDAVNLNQLNAAIAATDDKYVAFSTGTYARDAAATVGTNSATAIGPNASATAISAVALGGNSVATSQNGVALGTLARATANETTAVGVSAAATATNASAFGRSAAASANGAVALGYGSVADRANTVSVGTSTSQRQIANVAAGTQNTDAVNLGQLNAAIAAADNPYIRVNSGGSVHAAATATGFRDVAIGNGARSDALSAPGNSISDYAVALGSSASAGGSSATAIGAGALASTGANNIRSNVTALGANTAATAVGATAIGYGANANAGNSVALGTNSVADRANVVSVGSATQTRQIANVAAGTQNTDAVNVAQLNAAIANVDGNSPYFKANGALDGTDDASAIGAGSVAVGSNAKTLAAGGVAIGSSATAGMANGVAIGNSAIASQGGVAIGQGANVQSTNGVAIGTKSQAGEHGTALGNNALAVPNAVALGANASAVSENAVALGNGSVAVGNTVSVGSLGNERKITNVAEGTLSDKSTDAVNGSQLFATNARVGSLEDSLHDGGVIDPVTGKSLAVVYDTSAKNSVTLGGSSTAPPVQLKNVADATDANDAVNLSQLNKAVADAGTSSNPYIGGRGTGVAAQATALNAVALGLGSVANEINTISVGNSSTGLTRRITNLADGNAASDAATVGQVNALVGGVSTSTQSAIDDVNTKVAALDQRFSTNSIGTESIGTMAALDDAYIKVNSGGTAHLAATATGYRDVAIGNGTRSDSFSAPGGTYADYAVAVGSSASAGGTAATAIGAGALASTGANNIRSNVTALGASTSATAVGATAVGFGAIANQQNSVALGANSVADRDNVVSVGSAAQTRQIANVAAGTAETDAVNLGQLNKAVANVDNPYVKVDGAGDGSDNARVAAGSYGVAIGADSGASGTTGIAIGAGATSTNTSSIALGAGANARANNAMAFGANSNATGTGATAIGNGAVAAGNYGVALGLNSSASGSNGLALGSTSVAAGADSVALGTLSNVASNATNSVAIGRAAQVQAAATNSVALGSSSVADRLNSISVGSSGQQRQIIYVARGTANTDAVNVSQLKDAVAAFGGNASVGTDGSIVNPTYTIGGTTYRNVGDALNALSNLGGGGADPLAVTYGTNGDGSPNFEVVALKGADGTTLSNVKAGVADMDAVNVSQLKDSGLIGDDGKAIAAVVYDGESKDKVTLGGADGTTLANVKAGVADMDAVNVSQLKDSGLIGDDGKAIAAVTYDRNADGSPNLGSVTLGGTDGTTLANVKAGVADMDAVNVSQLKGSGLIGDDGKAIAAVTYDRNADGTPNYGSVTLGDGTNPTQLKHVADGTDRQDAVNLGQLQDSGLVAPVDPTNPGAGLTSLAVT